MARLEQELKDKLQYIKKAYPEVYGDRTIIEVSPYLTQEEIEEGVQKTLTTQSLRYRFAVPKDLVDEDNRVPHWRAVTGDGLVEVYERSEDKPDKVRSVTIKSGNAVKFEIDLKSVQGLMMLAFWLENPFTEVYGIENKFKVKPLYLVKIRGNVIHHDLEMINENGVIHNEIMDMAKSDTAVVDMTNLCAFLGVKTTGVTLAELTISLLGKRMDGIAYSKRADYRRYKAMTTDQKEIEVAVKKAMEHGFIKDTGAEGWKLDDGTPLGGTEASVLNYFSEKKAAMKKLLDRVQVKAEGSVMLEDVKEIIDTPSDGVRTERRVVPKTSASK